jgi:hypothetical protein
MDRHKGQRQPDQRHLRMRHDACRRLAADPRMQNDDRAAKYDREQCEHSRDERALLLLAVVTSTTTVAAASARSGMS